MPRSQITTTLARERAAAGKLLRKDVPREAHGHYEPASGRPDPLEMLDALAKRRLPFLIPLRDERIAETPFTYFRGTSIVMACDLANTPIGPGKVLTPLAQSFRARASRWQGWPGWPTGTIATSRSSLVTR